jgi:hypothetical protein
MPKPDGTLSQEKKADHFHNQSARKEGARGLIGILKQPKECKTIFKLHTSLHQPNPRVNLLESQ